MIANNSGNKLKASKGFRESDNIRLLVSEDKTKVVDRGEGDKDRYSSDILSKSSYSTSVVYSRERSLKPRSKHRDDFRFSRGTTERRGGSRGRGTTHRKMDKDGEVFIPRGKFQEPLMKGKSSDGVSSSSNKYTNDADGVKSKSADYGHYLGLPEDSRISKVLRRMAREDDPEKFIACSNQLQEALVAADNARYIRRSLDMICDSLLELLHSGPNYKAKLHAAKCLGRLGYALDQDFKRFMDWVFPSYSVERNDEVRGLLLKAVLETVQLEREQPRLKDFAQTLMSNLHVVLEGLEKSHLLLVAVEVILDLASIYPDMFTKYFTDTVDILVGWHIDLTTPPSVICYASQSLQRLSYYWANDIDFSVLMLRHFLEDTELTTDELTEPLTPPEDQMSKILTKEKIFKVTSFIKVFNSVMKGLGHHLSPTVSSTVTWTFLYDCLARMLSVVLKVLNLAIDFELIITGNECTWLLLNLIQSKTCPAHEDLYQLLDLEISLIPQLTKHALASTLQLVAKVIKELSANLPLELVQRILKPGSPFLDLRVSPCIHTYINQSILAVYHSLLSLKNIPLLKEAYRLILTDLDSAYRLLVPELTPLYAGIEPTDQTTYPPSHVERIVVFQLKALADIANASNSLIGMWVLQPSILELLASRLIPQSVGRVSPYLLYTQLYLLYSHCSRHSHFITTSNLVGGTHGRPAVNSLLGLPASDISQQSPTCGHFSVILGLLCDILNKEMCEESSLLVLYWCCELLGQSQPYMTTLVATMEMGALARALCACAATSLSATVLLAVCANLRQLIVLPHMLAWRKRVLEEIADVCLLHMDSSDATVAGHYSALLLQLPWTVVVPTLAQGIVTRSSVRRKLEVALHTQLTHDANTGEMSAHHFKQFMAFLLQGNGRGEFEWLQEMFTTCWSLSQTEPFDYESLRELTIASTTVLLHWATWESAQLCVNSKLRTPLGKAVDTFMTFEGVLKSLARQTVGSKTVGTEELNACQVRLLLEFVEQLEKTMYNASDGTASALIAPSKPVRSFFHTNKSTCHEWLSRNRSAIVVVALHAGMASCAIRHGYTLLQDLLDLGNTKGSEFENTVLQVAWALLRLKQSEPIHGLYVWCRDMVGLKFPCLKAMADQAAGKLETAVDSYMKIIRNEGLESPAKHPAAEHTVDITHTAKTLVADQITECYLALQDWTELAQWKASEAELFANQNGSSCLRYKYLTGNDVEALVEFEKECYSAASELLEWKTEAEPSPVSSPTLTWDCYKVLGTARHTLTKVAVKSVANGVIQDSDREMLRECQAVAHSYLVEGLRNSPSEVVQEAAILEFAANAMLSENKIVVHSSMDGSAVYKLNNVDSTLLARVLWWERVLDKLQVTSNTSTQYQLSLEAARLARKEGNLKLALSQLSHHVNQILHHDNGHRTSLVLTDDLLTVLDRTEDPWGMPHASAFAELSKLIYSVGSQQLALSMATQTCLRLADCEETAVREKCARLLLTVAKWRPLLDSPAALQELIDWQRNTTATSLLDISDFDMEGDPVGSVLYLAVCHCPSLAKSWGRLAGWAYRWGRRVTHQVLTAADKEAIDSLVPEGVNNNTVYSILADTTPPADDDDIEAENTTVSDMIEWQLQALGTFTTEQLSGLVDMWRKSHSRTYNFYQLSAHSYFRYLQLCDSPQEDSQAITATLRLLRLIVKHAQELQGVLEMGLSTTPTHPWVCIIPQLFSRLSHPQPFVRRRVTELLCRLAADQPHLIIFPSVVGSDAGAATIRDMPHTKLFSTATTRDLGEDLDMAEEEDEEFEDDEVESQSAEETQAMENCFQAMVDILAKQEPEGIAQVQVFVRELRRITLLWDELWLGTLVQHHTVDAQRIALLETEVARVDDNPHLSPAEKDRLVAEKHRTILKPILFVLEQLHAITSVTAETPHEIWFQEKFGGDIAEALEKLRCPADPRKPGDAWSALKRLHMKLQHRTQAAKRSAYSLCMSEISPTLAKLRDTQISMPGRRAVLTVAAIHDHIAVLPTKTKPKKLVFQGSDGKPYTYLFKGLEDLHLDERIMQFLGIANTMLRGSGYQARHYAVVPLGVRSGLISWVEGVTPLFSLYKRWQQRQASINQSAVMRPSEVFYYKLNPLLKECEVSNKPENRSEWPLAVLKQVLKELMQETPTYLLSRELWCDSVNVGGWWQSTKLYSTSLAVMSIIGYIIGLGDRHLDNVLVDLTTGQVVHIDYNVCFEKGKTLRVPEKVPFRLTPNLRAALGVTGVEGIFRLTCEHVLKVMKKGRETVLTLLEAFVYDPLIDWTPGSETGYTGAVYGGGRSVAMETRQSRKQLEKEVTTSMLAIRLVEIRYEWLVNRDKLVVGLPELAAAIQQWQAEAEKLKKAEEALQERHQQLALVKEAEAHVQHSLYTLPGRYAAHCTAADAAAKTQGALQARADECARQLQQYKMALGYLYGPQLAQWIAEVNSRNNHDHYLVFDLIKEFLQNAGQGQMVLQCIQSEKELCDLCCQQTQLTRACLDLLGQYGAIIRQFPVSHVSIHRTSLYHRWTSTLLQSPYPDTCDAVLAEMKVALSLPPLAQASVVLGYNMALQQLLAESRAQTERLMERVSQTEPVSDGEKALERVTDRSPLALQCVVITALCNLNKRFLVMESAAKSTKDCLVDLTSQKGEWFLDDMCLSAGTMVKLLSLLPTPEPGTALQAAVKCLHAAHNQYKGLQELNLNFSSIILPEAIQTIQREDPSVLTLLGELDAIIASVQMPLVELVGQLQLHLHLLVTGMGVTAVPEGYQAAVTVAAKLQEAVEAMFQRLGSSDPLTPGQMLLMGFNGLFDNLALGCCGLVTALAALPTPAVWRSVDQLREAKSLAAPTYDPAPRTVLDHIFLVKRLQAMQELFALCRANSESFKGIGATMPCDDDRLNRPIRCFTADYVSCQLLGVFSHTMAATVCLLLQHIGLNVTGEVEQREVGADSRVPLEDLCRAAVDCCIRQGAVTNAALSQASAAVSAVERGWHSAQLALRLTQDAQRMELTTQRLQLQLTAHYWLHEDTLAVAQLSPPISRATFMVELRKTCAALMALQPSLADALEQQNTLVASAEQRLKWAAGANPALAEVMCAFETTVNSNNEQLVMEQRLATLVASLCNSVLMYEALRTRTSEALANDTAFAQLVESAQQSSRLHQTLNTQLSALEESLVKLCPPDSHIDWAWIAKAEALISESVKALMKQMEPQRIELFAACDAIKSKALAIRSLLKTHNRTMADIRTLLKTMVKFEEPGVSEYLSRYRAYTERLIALIKTIIGLDELTQEKTQGLLQEVAIIQEETPGIYEELLQLSAEGENKANKRPPLVRQDSICVSPRRDPQTGKALQERNAYALGVWRRVRLRLEGMDPDMDVDGSRRYTVQEQVDWAINEATSLDNLALLFEGWTPWV